MFDNRDGTLSLFGTIVDHASAATAPAPGTAAATMTAADLASVGRTLSYNDHQSGARACSPNPCGEGEAADRNVELLLADPRRDPDASGGDKRRGGSGDRVPIRKGPLASCTNRIAGSPRGEALRGTSAPDLILGRGGPDRIRPRGGPDCVFAGRGDDIVRARRGGTDLIRCGRGKDVAYVSGKDMVRGCERIHRKS